MMQKGQTIPLLAVGIMALAVQAAIAVVDELNAAASVTRGVREGQVPVSAETLSALNAELDLAATKWRLNEGAAATKIAADVASKASKKLEVLKMYFPALRMKA